MLWPVLVPIIFIAVLMKARKSIRTNQITRLAESCRFLWGDYTPSMMGWDIVDTMRKIFSSGFIMFLDREQGSTKGVSINCCEYSFISLLNVASICSSIQAILGFLPGSDE